MIANIVTSIRIVLLAPLIVLLASTDPIHRWLALAIFLAAGLTDIIDGRLARALNEVSRTGAMLDLIADRLLTLTVLIGLVASGALRSGAVMAGLVFIVRDMVVASFGEAVPDLSIRVNALEKVKITLQFAAFGLLIAPSFFSLGPVRQHDLGLLFLYVGAALTVLTLWDYGRRTVARLKA